MNYTIMQSLERGALIKIVITLWNQDDIRDLIAKVKVIEYLPIEEQKMWRKVQDKVEEKVQELPLPESLRQKLSNFIQPIGFELLRLRGYYKNILLGKRDESFVRESLSNVCWTQQGTIDRKKMAEALIRHEKIDITERYKLACTYCLKDDILILWNKMPENCRKCFYSEDPRYLSLNALVLFWTNDIIKKKVAWIDMGGRRCTPYQCALEKAAMAGNKVATEFFIQNLTPEKRAEYLVRSVMFRMGGNGTFVQDYAGVYRFLLSQMRDEQQLKVLKTCHGDVLQSFLDWPWQGLFLETVKHMWAFLPKYVYDFLLLKIVTKVKNGYKDYNYQELFREFWQQSPITHKQYVIHECVTGLLLLFLFQIKDMENIKLILEDATALDREKIIFSLGGKRICKSLIFDEEIDLLEFFVQECISSKDAMVRFIEELEELINQSFSERVRIENAEYKMRKFIQLLNDLIEKYDK